jgi:predicted kinase
VLGALIFGGGGYGGGKSTAARGIAERVGGSGILTPPIRIKRV